MPSPTRYLAAWVPDWPIYALLRDRQEQAAHASRVDTTAPHAETHTSELSHASALSPDQPLALTQKHLITALSPQARYFGVRLGQRESDAQAICSNLQLLPHDVQCDARQFHAVCERLSDEIPNMTMVTPGLLTVPSRGPARYYRGEHAAARHIQTVLNREGFPAQVAVADSHFAACQAAFHADRTPDKTPPDPLIIPAGQSAQFLHSLPVDCAVDAEQARLLTNLGIHTLGEFAALDINSVHDRYGATGLTAWYRAQGLDPITHPIHEAPQKSSERQATQAALFDAKVRSEVTQSIDFPSPVATAEELTFICAVPSTEFINQLTDRGLVCTTLRITLTDDAGNQHERSWQHPQYFTDFDVQARLRWQASAYTETVTVDPDLPSWNGITRVVLGVDHWDYASRYEPELWATTANQRLHHQLSRLQGTLGYSAVTTAQVQGGRLLHERAVTTPWGSGTNTARHQVNIVSTQPWPGSLPEPRPTIVYTPPEPVLLLSSEHSPVTIDRDDLLTQRPALFCLPTHQARSTAKHAPPSASEAASIRVQGWSAPWPIRERWWRSVAPTHRLQVTLENGTAWLLLHRHGKWYAEGRYD